MLYLKVTKTFAKEFDTRVARIKGDGLLYDKGEVLGILRTRHLDHLSTDICSNINNVETRRIMVEKITDLNGMLYEGIKALQVLIKGYYTKLDAYAYCVCTTDAFLEKRKVEYFIPIWW